MTAGSVPLDPAPFESTPPRDRSALQPAGPVPHLLPVRVARDEAQREDWHDHVRHSDRRRFRPVVILEVDQADQAERVAGELVALAPACELWISYSLGQEEPAELLASALRNRYALDVTPVRLN